MASKIVLRKAKAKAKKKPVLSPALKAEIKLKNDHRSLVRIVFDRTGFRRVVEASDQEFSFENQPTDFDDIFVYENIIVLAEYTCSQSSNVGAHLKAKKIVYDKIFGNPQGFLAFLKTTFPTAAAEFASKYHPSQVMIKIAYCSRFDFEDSHKTNVPGPVYLDYPALRYFGVVTHAIKRSARYELLHFLGIEVLTVGMNGAIPPGVPLNLSRDIFPAARCVLLICFLSTTNTPQLAAGIFY